MAADAQRLAARLEAHGARREQALTAARAELDELRRLVPLALAAGLRKADIARLTGLGRPTIDRYLDGAE
jgi:multidrug efflux pump subunit AcrA (membrane-fusion protein)